MKNVEANQLIAEMHELVVKLHNLSDGKNGEYVFGKQLSQRGSLLASRAAVNLVQVIELIESK